MTVGPEVVGKALKGLELGDPGTTIGPSVGMAVTGVPLVGLALGDPGATVGPAVVGEAEALAGATVGL